MGSKLIGLALFILAFFLVNNLLHLINFLILPKEYFQYLTYLGAILIFIGAVTAFQALKIRGGMFFGIFLLMVAVGNAAIIFFFWDNLLEGYGPLYWILSAFIAVIIGFLQFQSLLVSPARPY